MEIIYKLGSIVRCSRFANRVKQVFYLLKHACEIVTLSGEDPDSSRRAKWKLLKDGNYQVLVTTGQFFGEGTDLQNTHCLFLVYPFSFEGKLIQYMARVQRSEITHDRHRPFGGLRAGMLIHELVQFRNEHDWCFHGSATEVDTFLERHQG